MVKATSMVRAGARTQVSCSLGPSLEGSPSSSSVHICHVLEK